MESSNFVNVYIRLLIVCLEKSYHILQSVDIHCLIQASIPSQFSWSLLSLLHPLAFCNSYNIIGPKRGELSKESSSVAGAENVYILYLILNISEPSEKTKKNQWISQIMKKVDLYCVGLMGIEPVIFFADLTTPPTPPILTN